MPALYRYKAFTFLKYSNDHDPPHVHVKKGDVEIKVTFFDVGGATWTQKTKIRKKFSNAELSDIDEFIGAYGIRILAKLEVLISGKKKPKCEKINKIKEDK